MSDPVSTEASLLVWRKRAKGVRAAYKRWCAPCTIDERPLRHRDYLSALAAEEEAANELAIAVAA